MPVYLRQSWLYGASELEHYMLYAYQTILSGTLSHFIFPKENVHPFRCQLLLSFANFTTVSERL